MFIQCVYKAESRYLKYGEQGRHAKVYFLIFLIKREKHFPFVLYEKFHITVFYQGSQEYIIILQTSCVLLIDMNEIREEK